MFLELPEISPPNVKALMVKVPLLYGLMVLVKRAVVPVRVVALRPFDRAREPAKELEPVLVELNAPAVSMPLVV
jgi:hypothetical protein